MKRLIAIVVLLWSSPAWATPTINGTPVSAFANDSSTVSVSVTVAAGSNRLAIITVSSLEVNGTVDTFSSVVFNGSENATLIGRSQGAYVLIEQWYLKMPSVTTANMVATSIDTTDNILGISVVVLDGAMQTGTPHRTQTCQEDEVGTTQPDLNVEAVAGDLSIDGIMTWLDAITDPDAGQTERIDATGTRGGDTTGVGVSTETASDTSTEMGWTKSGSDNFSQYCGVSIISAASATPTAGAILRRRRN